MHDAIAIRGVTKTFGPKVAVRNLDLTVRTGGLYGLIGPNGAGKTTTIRMVMAIAFPDRGEISVLGKPSAVESKDRIGYLPEERGLYRKMKVGAYLAYIATLKGIDGAGLDRRVKDWLERVQLAEVYRKRCQELSKGMQQKVQFLAAVIHDPDLIILDEPFSGLDPVNARLMRELIDEIHRQGRTIIFSTHVMQHAEQICDHVIMFNRGSKVLDASMREIQRSNESRTVAFEPLDDTADLVPVRAIPGVSELAAFGVEQHAVLDDTADPAAVIARIAALVPVRRIEQRRASLEDIFIDLVHGDTDAPGSGDEEVLRAALREEPATPVASTTTGAADA